MKKLSSSQIFAALSVAVAGFLIAPSLVLAQSDIDPAGEIIVQAPFELDRQEVKPSSSSAVETEVVELKRQVSISDLDLADPDDVAALNARIRMVAEDSCEQLAKMFPLDNSDIPSFRRCTRKAIASAMDQVEAAIAEAQK